MPGRLTPLVNGQAYHIFNRGIDRRPTFTNKRECQRAIEAINLYQFSNPPLKLSKFLKLADEERNDIVKTLIATEKLIEVLSYCLMPNHFHFLLLQKKEGGIAKFLSNFQNSYTRYFNTRHERDGSLFLDQFKAVRIETEEQLVHVSRYIHLNPHTGFVVKTLEELESYPWSSFSYYIIEKSPYVDSNMILSRFGKAEEYKQFVFDQADYARKLKEVEHLILE